MRYQALANRQYIDTPQLNIFASRLDADLTAVLEGYVLPHRLPHQPTYTQKDAQLYVARRAWIADIPLKIEGPLTFRYERAIHEILWRSENHPEYRRKKLIFLTGTVGCGKSTLVDYYFRCFCPGLPPAENRYLKKLVIHVDLKGTNTIDEIFSRFITDAKTSLEMKNKLHADLAHVIQSTLPYREKLMELLKAISKKIHDNELEEIKHLILCIDNIDQSPLEIQKIALNLVQTILEEHSGIGPLKCIFPLWPRTLSTFQRHNIIRLQREEYDEIRLSPPNLQLLFKRRQSLLRKRQKAASKIDLLQFVRSVERRIDPSDKVFLQHISYSNIKLMLHTVNEMLCSKSIVEYKLRYPPYVVFRDYQFVDALVCGRYRTHNQDVSHILNVFDISANPESYLDSLCGLYVLYYLKHQNYQESAVLNEMEKCGFLQSTIKMVLDAFADFHLIHFDLPNDVERTFHVHFTVVESYRRLIRQPAALDNFAQSTRIDPSYLEGMRPTLGYEESDFCDRVEMTINFLDFIRTEELNLDASILKEGEQETFINLRKSMVPHVYRELAYSYFTRLHALKIRNQPVHASVTNAWWKNALGLSKRFI